MTVTLTQLPNLNNTIVIKQSGEHFFIAAPDSIIIDKSGLLRLIEELVYIEFIDYVDVDASILKAQMRKAEERENKENDSNTDSR